MAIFYLPMTRYKLSLRYLVDCDGKFLGIRTPEVMVWKRVRPCLDEGPTKFATMNTDFYLRNAHTCSENTRKHRTTCVLSSSDWSRCC